MPNNRLEALLQGIGDGAQLEQLAADLLVREGYKVDPTGTRGPDRGRDALLTRNGEFGILHCSIAADLENKINDDVEKAANRPDKFDFFIFATTQNPSGTKRDRLEEELRDKYGWCVRIYDLQRLRNKLSGDPSNHDLIREHLHIDPNQTFQNPQQEANEFYEERLERLHNRRGQYGTLVDEDSYPPMSGEEIVVEAPPILAVHIVPAEAFASVSDRSVIEFPDPPSIGPHRGSTEQYGSYVISGRIIDSDQRDVFSHYACFHEDGWAESATTDTWAGVEKPRLTPWFDKLAVDFVQDALKWYREIGIHPPFYVYLTVLDAAEYKMYVENRISGPFNERKIGTNELRLGDVTIESYDADIPIVLREPLDRLWRQTGWSSGSPHYTEKVDEKTGETSYEWNPPER